MNHYNYYSDVKTISRWFNRSVIVLEEINDRNNFKLELRILYPGIAELCIVKRFGYKRKAVKFPIKIGTYSKTIRKEASKLVAWLNKYYLLK